VIPVPVLETVPIMQMVVVVITVMLVIIIIIIMLALLLTPRNNSNSILRVVTPQFLESCNSPSYFTVSLPLLRLKVRKVTVETSL
jgi:hypothetical protein